MAPSPMDISAALLSIPEKRDYLCKAFGDLEEHRALIASSSQGWKELDSSLSAIHDALEKRYAEIVEKETKFEERMKELQEALDKRESVIESREQASLARVQEQKDAAVAAIREQKRKWIEEKQLLQSQSPAKPDPDTPSSKSKQDTKVQKDESEKPKGVGTKKDNMSEKEKEGTSQKIEESSNLNDIAGIVEGSICNLEERMESEICTKVATDSLQNTALQDQAKEAQSKPGSAEVLKDNSKAMSTGDDDGINVVDEEASDDDEKEVSPKKVESSQSVVTARPELISFCEKMDGPGLYTYLIAQKKDIKDIRKELSIAMKSASDPSGLVLQAIKEYHPSSGTEGSQVKKLASRRSCITLLESLAAFFDAEGKTVDDVSDDVKEKAKYIAELWKSKLNQKESEREAQLDAQGFLQLVATFQLTSNFSEDELGDLVIPICFRKQTIKLWRALGLAHKTSDLVDKLIKGKKHLDAISFVQEFQLTKKFPPANLFKGYLREARKRHTSFMTAEDKDELHIRELNALKTVVKCVEKFKLEGEYPVESLERRIEQLEKISLGDKKRVADTNMGGLKKARAINGPGGPFRPPDRFGGRGNAGRSYGSPYARGGLGGGYPYPAGGRGHPSSYTHGSYPYGGGSPYQGPYLR